MTFLKSVVQFKILVAFITAAMFYVAFIPSASADPDIFSATIDVVEESAVVGESITLAWYVEGGPATCTINHDVESFEITENPQGGTVSAIVPASGEPFVITCSKGGDGELGDIVTDNVVVIPNPVITFDPEHGTELVNALEGSRAFWLDWNAEYATECSAVTYILASSPGTVLNPHITIYSNGDGLNGKTRYLTEGGVRVSISETSTFYITCQNNSLGTETTESITITIVDPPAPEPVVINVIQPVDNPAEVERDDVRNYGTVRYEFRVENATYCTDYTAYNLHEYPAVEAALPVGYLAWTGLMYRNIELRLGTSTVLTVRCGRPEINIGGVIYPATSTTLVKTFNVGAASVSQVATSSAAYASATVTITPDTVERNAITGSAYISANVTASNADYCNLTAYQASDLVEYDLPGWTRSFDWNRLWSDGQQNIDRTYTPAVSTTTKLQARCVNIYDFYFGTAEEKANAVTYATDIVTVTPPAGPVDAPDVWLYSGPSLHLTADDIWDLQTNNNNMRKDNVYQGLDREHIQVDTSYASGNILSDTVGEIVFTFNHPHGADRSDVYNIHMRHCDESDGAATYTFSTDGSGVIGSYVSDKSYPGQDVNCGSETEEVTLVAEGVVLNDGDEITIACTASQAVAGVREAEECKFSDIYIGTGSGSRVLSVPEDIDAPTNTLIWMSERATRCKAMEAETNSGLSYVWSYSQQVYGSLIDAPLGPITTYNITCDRAIDGVETTEDVEVITSNDPDAPLDVEETVSDEATYEVGACWDVIPEPDVLLSNAPANYVVAPDDLHLIPGTFILRSSQCVPLVDLSVSPVYRGTNLAADSVIDIGDGVDNVNGTYNLSIVPYVQNLASVGLPANASIPYRVTLSGGSVNEINSGLYNVSLPANTAANTYELTDENYDGIMFGTYDVEVRFNLDGAPNYPDSNFANNLFTDSVVLAVPTPHMTLVLPDGRSIIDTSAASVDSPLVRAGESTDLSWSVNVNYPLECTLTGPGIGTQNLALGTIGNNNFGLNPSTADVAVSLQSTSEFQLECTEPITGTIFTETGLVEVVPNFQEL